MSEKRGLYGKYIITKADTGEPIEGPAFVLRPAKDDHALHALREYAISMSLSDDNPELVSDLFELIRQIDDKNQYRVRSTNEIRIECRECGGAGGFRGDGIDSDPDDYFTCNACLGDGWQWN